MALEGDYPLALKAFRAILMLMLSSWLWGCATVIPERKTPSNSPKILEEDTTNDRAAKPKAEGGESSGVSESPQSAEGAPYAMPPERREPRRYIWKDRKGAVKGWESSTEGTDRKEP